MQDNMPYNRHGLRLWSANDTEKYLSCSFDRPKSKHDENWCENHIFSTTLKQSEHYDITQEEWSEISLEFSNKLDAYKTGWRHTK